MIQTVAQVTLGNWTAVAGYNLDGYQDCSRFWDKVLTQEEITAISTAELNGIDINP